jgi:CheY-like chemotaxis protein
MPRDNRPVFSIGAVARMTGVPAATLRAWEDRYRLVVPQRSPGGHRLYTREQVEQIRYVAARVGEGMQPGDAHRLLDLRKEDRMPPAPAEGAPRLLILLAERDPHAAAFSEYFLGTEGYGVLTAMSAADAEALVETERPDLVVLDLLISGGEGLTLCRRLTQDGGGRVLAISTLETREAALDAGADAFLQKPIDPLQLVSTVRDLLGASALAGGS